MYVITIYNGSPGENGTLTRDWASQPQATPQQAWDEAGLDPNEIYEYLDPKLELL